MAHQVAQEYQVAVVVLAHAVKLLLVQQAEQVAEA
jgi:hypothetical protein